jgi:hypothetical protein
MNRKIEFRGRCARSNDWVRGDLIHGVGWKSGYVYILPQSENLAYIKHCDPLDGVQVHPESVGQFTGMLDMNGVDVYEGDIVNLHNETFGYVTYSSEDDKINFEVRVAGCEYVLYRPDINLRWGRLSRAGELNWQCEVVDNIHKTQSIK